MKTKATSASRTVPATLELLSLALVATALPSWRARAWIASAGATRYG
jgi:hypothetical protein